MARLIKDRVALATKDETVLIDVMLELYKLGLWDANCTKIQNSFLQWVMPFRDTLDAIFDKARANGIQFDEFSTDNPNGYPGDQIRTKGLDEDEIKLAKTKHIQKLRYRRSRAILNKSVELGMTKDEVNSCFPNIQHEETESDRIENKIEFLGEAVLSLDKSMNELKEMIMELKEKLS